MHSSLSEKELSCYAGHSSLSCYYNSFLKWTCLKSARNCWALPATSQGFTFPPQTDLVLIHAVGVHAPLNVPGCSLAFVRDSLLCLPAHLIEKSFLQHAQSLVWFGDAVAVALRGIHSSLREVLFSRRRRQISSSRGIHICKWQTLWLCLCIKSRDAEVVPWEHRTWEGAIN